MNSLKRNTNGMHGLSFRTLKDSNIISVSQKINLKVFAQKNKVKKLF